MTSDVIDAPLINESNKNNKNNSQINLFVALNWS